MTSRDKGHVEEIINHLKRVENDYRIDLTSEMEWLRRMAKEMTPIPIELYNQLDRLGIIPNDVRDHNIGKSDYSRRLIQPWTIILEYNLNYWDGDVVKRVLRTKEGDSRLLDYEKIIHICQERIRQIKKQKH